MTFFIRNRSVLRSVLAVSALSLATAWGFSAAARSARNSEPPQVQRSKGVERSKPRQRYGHDQCPLPHHFEHQR